MAALSLTRLPQKINRVFGRPRGSLQVSGACRSTTSSLHSEEPFISFFTYLFGVGGNRESKKRSIKINFAEGSTLVDKLNLCWSLQKNMKPSLFVVYVLVMAELSSACLPHTFMEGVDSSGYYKPSQVFVHHEIDLAPAMDHPIVDEDHVVFVHQEEDDELGFNYDTDYDYVPRYDIYT
ncbi:hypothetical protein SK128_023270 [Halocaridina rubra]|uniref:Uncharacterized protein n=1 Tax=Halocaridina rubra TaxID=373956 RepID=A0AAN8WJW7_HALRR